MKLTYCEKEDVKTYMISAGVALMVVATVLLIFVAVITL